MNALTATTVLVALQRHVGRARGVTAEQLAYETTKQQPHASELRQLRKCISALREAGVAICGRPESGYFVAATAAELEESCAFLRARALHSLMLEAKLRKIPLPDLLGQLRLPT